MHLSLDGTTLENSADQLPLVVLHGGGPGCHAAADSLLLLPHFPRPATYLLDLPGYGATPLGSPSMARFTAYAAYIDATLARAGIEVCDIVTQSLGGIASMALASITPSRVRRLVAISSQPVPAPGGIHVAPELGRSARSRYYRGVQTRDTLVEHVMSLEWLDVSRIPSNLIDQRFEASVSPTALAIARDPSIMGLPEDLSALLPSVAARTLIVWGEHDPFGEPAYGEWLARQLPSAEFVVISDSAHHPQAEQPIQTARVAAAFLGY
jgi:pimeloyl-ACP methyl ester carboxylesterase